LLLIAGLVAALALIATSSAAAQPTPTQTAKYDLTFASASDTFTFQVAKGADNPAGALTVDTVDCCIAGDLWKVAVDTAHPANPALDKSATGDGDTAAYSGAATVTPFIDGSVTVSYSSGNDFFPAEMCVRFQYSKAPGVVITPPAGAIENGPACI
jgi:hypothetical protein